MSWIPILTKKTKNGESTPIKSNAKNNLLKPKEY